MAKEPVDRRERILLSAATLFARKGVAGTSIVLKLKTSDFRILTRNRRLSHPTQRAAVLLESALALVETLRRRTSASV